jgi:ribosome-binding factor A
MPNLRHERVRELLKRAIGEAIRREFHVNDVGVITVNDLDVGGDLRTAVVFISILGNDTQKKHGLQELEKNRIRIQAIVGKSVILKYTPTLKFIIDDSVTRGNRVLQILDELEKTSPPADSGTGVPPVRSDENKSQ